MKKLFNNKGLTLIEIIMTLSILGVVVTPLMGMLITSQKINSEGSREYKSLQVAQQYMEEIKAMETFNYNGYTRTEESGNYKYTKTIHDTESNLDVNIEISSIKEDDEEVNVTEEFDGTLTINSSIIKYEKSGGTLPVSVAIGGAIDMNVNDSGITIEGTQINSPLIHNILKVYLESDATINITNNLTDIVSLYIYNIGEISTYNCTLNVLKGEVQKINNHSITSIKDTAENILYYIHIKILDKGELINEIKSTTIFKYRPISS